MKQYFSSFTEDLKAGLVVFLVALPLCLGIALASGAPLFAGVIAGIIGGVVVGAVSKSPLGVSGPAAGLTVIVLTAIQSVGSFEAFLLAVVLAGVLQIAMSFIGAGKIASFFPLSVINGMLAAIGIIIILKQFPHAFGIDRDPEGDLEFFQPDGQTTFTELLTVVDYFNTTALLIGTVCLAILILWEQPFIKKIKVLQSIPASLICVLAGIFINKFMPENQQLGTEHLVMLPVGGSVDDFLKLPNFSAISSGIVWQTAFVLAIVASLETLLCVEATDKLDPQKRITPTNRELLAQGVGNIVSGLIGGLPLTQVIVRSSANIQSGGKTKLSTIIHGSLLLLSVIFFPVILNMIPLAALAAVLIMVGYKLAKPSLFKAMYKEGLDMFVPFIITIVAIVFTDLLKGICIGLLVGLAFVIYTNFKSSVSSFKENGRVVIKFNKDVFFFNKNSVINALDDLKSGDKVYIDATNADFIDHDIFVLLKDFAGTAKQKNIDIETSGITRKKMTFRKVKPPKTETLPV
jgi:MFS superfamily sulfate permease-like transporter